MNWLERARREILESAPPTTANDAERDLLAAMAVLDSASLDGLTASFGSIGGDLFEEIPESELLREDFEERAAIMEYDGGMSRDDADRAAWAIVTRHQRFH